MCERTWYLGQQKCPVDRCVLIFIAVESSNEDSRNKE